MTKEASEQKSALFGQSNLAGITLGMKYDVPGMIGAIEQHLKAWNVLRYSDIDPLFEDITTVLMEWVRFDKKDLVQKFLRELQTVLLSHPPSRTMNATSTPEQSLMRRLSVLGAVLGIILRRNVIQPNYRVEYEIKYTLGGEEQVRIDTKEFSASSDQDALRAVESSLRETQEDCNEGDLDLVPDAITVRSIVRIAQEEKLVPVELSEALANFRLAVNQ
jgi:hypothetical protein